MIFSYIYSPYFYVLLLYLLPCFKSSRNQRYLVLPFGLGLSLHLVFNFLLNLTIYTKNILGFLLQGYFFIYIKISFLGFYSFLLTSAVENSVSRILFFYIDGYLRNSVSRILFSCIAVRLLIIN